MLYSNKEYINAVKQVVKIFENGLYYFTFLISVRYKFLEGPFASRTESIKPPKIVKNQKYVIPVVHSSPVVHSTVYTLPF